MASKFIKLILFCHASTLGIIYLLLKISILIERLKSAISAFIKYFLSSTGAKLIVHRISFKLGTRVQFPD